MSTTAHTEVGALRRVLVCSPRRAFGGAQRIAAQWQELNYRRAPRFERAVEEFEVFCETLASVGAEVVRVPYAAPATLDAIYVRDAALITDAGAILCSMGKQSRRHEPRLLRPHLEAAGVAALGAITGEGRLEGGDACWLPGNRLAVGRGYRTNDEGIRQLRELTATTVEEFVVVPLPHWRGPADVFHLMSVLSPLSHRVMLVHSPLLPVSFREWLLRRGMRLVEVAAREFDTMGCNVLALNPGTCLMLGGCPETRSRIEAEGIEVITYRGDEISRAGEGGPTCLTRPLVREQ